jgi:hypothetical protein
MEHAELVSRSLDVESLTYAFRKCENVRSVRLSGCQIANLGSSSLLWQVHQT